MSSSKLAILGGKPIRTKPYPMNATTGKEEERAAIRVLKKRVLSEFEGTNNQYFLGGNEVKALENEWASKFGKKYAVSFNSATSALAASVGASSIGPGDEVIVTPFTMTATVASILVYNAIPIFADLETDYFNLDPRSIEEKITKRTRAILIVNIFGHSADMSSIMKIAKKHNLKVIEDAAQSIGSFYKGKPSGTIGDIGIYSLNCNKHIQCGEGGIAVTDDESLAERMRLIRNHAEAVLASGRPYGSLVNMLGWNYRMNEIEAAIGREQLKKLDGLVKARQGLVQYLNSKLRDIDGLILPIPRKDSTHAYYRYAVKLDVGKIGIEAPLFVKALNAEGMDFYTSYVPLYMQPMYQNGIVYGDKGCPFKCRFYDGKPDYSKGTCPNAEKLMKVLLSAEIVRPPQTAKDLDEIVTAFKKIIANKKALMVKHAEGSI